MVYLYIYAHGLLFYMHYLYLYLFQYVIFFHSVSQISFNIYNFLFLFFGLYNLLVFFLKELNKTNSKWESQQLSPSSFQIESSLGEAKDDSIELHLKNTQLQGKLMGKPIIIQKSPIL